MKASPGQLSHPLVYFEEALNIVYAFLRRMVESPMAWMVVGGWVVFLLGAYTPPLALAQSNDRGALNEVLDDLGDLDQAVETGPPQEASRSFADFLREDFSGQLGFNNVAGGITRGTRFFDLNYNAGPEWLRLALRGQVRKTEITFTLKRKESDGSNRSSFSAGQEPTITQTLTSSKSELAEAYLQSRVGPFLLRVGKQTIVLGQFDIFSPIDFVLPFRSDSTGGVEFSKVNNRLPQNAASLSWFLFPWMELQYHYFPDSEVDPLVAEALRGDRERQNFVADMSNFSGFREELETARIKNPDEDEDEQTVSRILFYPSWGVFGFTYYRGFDFTNIQTNATLEERTGTYVSSGVTQNRTIRFRQVNPEIRERQAKGFEMAVRSGKWTWKLEVLQAPQREDIGRFFSRTFEDPGIQSSNNPPQQAFLSWVKDKNEGKLYLESEMTFAAFGFDAEPGRWRLNFALYHFGTTYKEGQERGRELNDAVEKRSSSEMNVVPSFHMARYVGQGTDTSWGLALGIVGGGQGFLLYFNQLAFDGSLRWGVALEAVEYFNDGSLEDASPGGDYELEDKSSAGLRYGMAYLF